MLAASRDFRRLRQSATNVNSLGQLLAVLHTGGAYRAVCTLIHSATQDITGTCAASQ